MLNALLDRTNFLSPLWGKKTGAQSRDPSYVNTKNYLRILPRTLAELKAQVTNLHLTLEDMAKAYGRNHMVRSRSGVSDKYTNWADFSPIRKAAWYLGLSSWHVVKLENN